MGKSGPGTSLIKSAIPQPGVVQQRQASLDNLAQIMRRYVGCHPDGDTRRAIDQQLRDARRQNRRFMFAFIIVGNKIDCFHVDVGQQFLGAARHADFGIAQRCGGVAVHGAEITLPVHEDVAHGEFLGHAHDGVVNRGIPVGVVLPDHVAHQPGRLLVGAVIVVAQFPHGVQYAAMHRFEAVAGIGQRSTDDYAHGVIEVGPPHLVFEIDRKNLFRRRRHRAHHRCGYLPKGSVSLG